MNDFINNLNNVINKMIMVILNWRGETNKDTILQATNS